MLLTDLIASELSIRVRISYLGQMQWFYRLIETDGVYTKMYREGNTNVTIICIHFRLLFLLVREVWLQ